MSLTLYRKYRPQTFKEVVGQNHIKTTIQSELESNKIAHAYLFSGPRGLGKTTMARLLAKAVNCLKRKDGQSEPCNTCDSCQELMNSRSLDIVEIDAASHTGVDNVRENIINNSRFTPTSRKFKVFIIDEVHMLSISAFNALLKTLEEPPAHALFILATTEIHKVPETIISRCQHFEFRKVQEVEIVKRLLRIVTQEKRKIDQVVLENVAYHAGGCLRDAESLLGQILSLGDKEITLEQSELVLPRSRFDLALELISYLIKSDSTQSVSLVNHLVQEGINLEKFTADLVEILRKILLVKISPQLNEFSGGLDKDLEKKVVTIAEQTTLEFLIRAIEILISRQQELKFADIPQLPLELAMLEIINDKKDADNDSNQSGGTTSIQESKRIEKTQKQEKPEEPIAQKQAPIKAEKTLGKIKLSLEQVKEKWQEVLICLQKHNYSLASTLKICQPSEVCDGTLEICLKHKFHQQRLNDLKNRKILEQVLYEIFGVKLLVRTVVVKDLPNQKIEIEALTESKTDEGLDNILKNFGGQVVE